VTVPTLVTHEPAFPFGSFELCQEVAASIEAAEFIIIDENSIAGRVHDANVSAIDRFLREGTTIRAAVHAWASAAAASRDCNGLTPRELEVLRHVTAGSTNKEIAGCGNAGGSLSSASHPATHRRSNDAQREPSAHRDFSVLVESVPSIVPDDCEFLAAQFAAPAARAEV
jgi:hypothetical protein